MSIEKQLQRARINGICCAADGEVRPFSSDLPTILRAIEVASYVGLRVRLDADHVKELYKHMRGAGKTAADVASVYTAGNPS